MAENVSCITCLLHPLFKAGLLPAQPELRPDRPVHPGRLHRDLRQPALRSDSGQGPKGQGQESDPAKQ